ncbi:MAG: VWA domain-containing protein [Acidobacteria bacterium]|nr:VWA domain-containing protein [Acidobacteriota bacterium]
MVVGPRYAAGPGINPLTAPKGVRPGHDISIDVRLGMATELGTVQSESHAIKQTRHNNWFETITLAAANEIPNKDFLLKYRVASRAIAPSLLTHRVGNEGYFSFVLDPPSTRPEPSSIARKELVFVIDTSGSMHGFPLDKAKEAMIQAIEGLNPRDTFNLITFSGDTDILWPKPVPATAENIAKAKQFLSFKNGGVGTEMMKAIRAALDDSDSQEHLRVVCFMTDGYVGNDNEIIAEIRKHSNVRVFSFGIGSSVNRFLLDKMAEAGRGEVEYVSLNSDGSAAARRFHERVRNPLLTDISIDFNGLPVTDVVPARIPDLFSAKPIIVSGRYTAAAQGRIRVRGRIGSQPYERFIEVRLPEVQKENDAVPLIWARRQIDSLSIDSATNREAITQLGLKYSLMTAFTSYYAIDNCIVNEGGISRQIAVPVAMPEGVRMELADNRMAVRTLAVAPVSIPVAKSVLRIHVGVLLKNATAATLAKLKQLGFIADPAATGALYLTGSIDATRLEELRRLDTVKRVEEME